MLGTLAIAGFRVVLFPCKAGALPFREDIVYEVLPQRRV